MFGTVLTYQTVTRTTLDTFSDTPRGASLGRSRRPALLGPECAGEEWLLDVGCLPGPGQRRLFMIKGRPAVARELIDGQNAHGCRDVATSAPSRRAATGFGVPLGSD
ncbi:hypothetical protein [Micromonospora rubida]|uniref:hypothetical protein n=1 Tax=Micromonospora rubida TaxID=2697657 RepID=UPI001378141B|nr:hypothetical protein [Micromonospora rubida]NBE83375.1 hypothetical protein [Micromonospora rubida]